MHKYLLHRTFNVEGICKVIFHCLLDNMMIFSSPFTSLCVCSCNWACLYVRFFCLHDITGEVFDR